MESGINGDQNFYSRRQFPRSPEQHQTRLYEPPPPLPQFESRSPQVPPKLSFLTTSNLQAVTSDGYADGLSSGGGDPDEFYKRYRGVQQASNSFIDISTNGMAATASESRPTPSSLRSNGNGTTAKHPSLPTARHNLKPTYRAASTPIDDRIGLANAKSTSALNGYGQSRQTSVKNLLKRFDQNNEPPSSTTGKPPPRIATKDTGAVGPGYMRDRAGYHARTTGNTQNAEGALRAGVLTRDGGPPRVKSPATARNTQRTRFATEDQHSNNTLSSVARSARPRNLATGSNVQASKSMSNLSPTSPNPPPQRPARKPLFGEVLPMGQGLLDIGYGIPHTAARRTSDSSLHPPRTHHRNRSDHDVSPSSPTAWYLGVTPALDDVDPNKPRSSPGHNRSHSDFADGKVNTMNRVNASPFQSPAQDETLRSSSRLPLASERLLGLSDPSSASSSRATSPFTNKTPSNGKLPKPDQRPWSPVGRAITPTHTASTPPRQSPHGRARRPEKLNENNSSLKAYISAPPPLASPPLRSSRPRQPISSASPASSRRKIAEGSGPLSQGRMGMKVTAHRGAQDTNPRKIVDIGPVDFAARRARIQRAYTKSIHENEQREIRAANMRRLNERHARDSITGAEGEQGDQKSELTPAEFPLEMGSSPPKPPKPLHVSTCFPSLEAAQNNKPAAYVDSPTLGIPGSFVFNDETPPSAISNATGTTEIDNEAQTEAPRFNRISFTERSAPRMLSPPDVLHLYDLSPDEASYGMGHALKGNDDGSIQIILDATPVEEPQRESTPTNGLFPRDSSPAGAFEQGAAFMEYDQPIFTSIVTTASPKQTTPEQSRPTTPLEVGDETGLPSGLPNFRDEGIAQPTYTQSQNPPDILFSADADQSSTPESGGAPRLDLAILRTALAAPSKATNEAVQDYMNTPVTDIDYESSDGLGPANACEHDIYDRSDEPNRDVQNAFHQYRASHQSVWTDYSVDTADEWSEQGTYPQLHVSLDPEQKPRPPSEERSPSPKHVVAPNSEAYSPQPSPLYAKDTPLLASPNDRQLPPFNIGDGFGPGVSGPFPTVSSTAVPVWPDYSPPPPPIDQRDLSNAHQTRSPPPLSFYNKRPPSSIYQSSQNGTSRNAESRRASDDAYSPRASTSTPRSSTQISLEDVTASQTLETEEEKKAAEKLKKRLFQRLMLIKELIDTEAVYLKDMNVVEEIYKGTAEACPKLDSNDIKAIFRNTDEIVAFSTTFLDELKSASSSVYSPRAQRSRQGKAANGTSATTSPATEERFSIGATTLNDETDEQKDRKTFIGANFGKHLKKMQSIYTDFLKNSELASTRLTALQTDGAVKVWLSECNLVAKDLTAAWDLDALLVKPVQRITRYQLLLAQIFEHTAEDHPDYAALQVTCRELAGLLKNIDDLKRRIHMVGKIVGRKRKESDVRSGLAKAFGRRAEKVQASNANRPHDDETYLKLHEKFGHDYLKLQIILRDVEFYTRQITTYVHDFLRYLSSIELVMRLSASPYPEIESKWTRFNMSMRDMETVALENHVAAVRKRVIEPVEQVIQSYGPPGLAMKKRSKRRLDYEKSLIAKAQGKKIDEKLAEFVDQYEALNETLKLELPKLSSMTEKIGNICIVQFVTIQTEWYSIWQDKVRVVLEDSQLPKDVPDIIDMFNRDYKYVQARAQELGIVNGTYLDNGTKTRGSSLSAKDDDASTKSKSRPPNLSTRHRGLSLAGDKSPSLPTPDFAKRLSGQFTFSPIVETTPGNPLFAYQNPSSSSSHSRAGSGSPATPDTSLGSRPHASSHARPSTGRSYTSDNGVPPISSDYSSQLRRESSSTYNSGSYHVDGPLQSSRPYSGVFHSAMPLPDGPEDSQRSSRASSRDRNVSGGYNVLYLAASLFEFNISATKSEAGYPYLTYQAGEIFDVIGEKGELWLAKNQDDPSDTVGWIWSKHFARLAND